MATIIDAHTHLGLEKFIVKRIPDEKRKRPAFRDPMEHRLERLLAQMDRNGVARAVAFPMPLEEVGELTLKGLTQPVAAFTNSIVSLGPYRLHAGPQTNWHKAAVSRKE